MRFSQIYKRAQLERLQQAIRLAGARYTPQLNIEVNIASVFDGLGRTRIFYDQLKRPGQAVLKNLRGIGQREMEELGSADFDLVKSECLAVVSLLDSIPVTSVFEIDFKTIRSISERARAAVAKCAQLVRDAQAAVRRKREAERSADKRAAKNGDRSSFSEAYRNELHYLYELSSVLQELIEFSTGTVAEAANNPRVLLSGIAGSGKTHFLCDLAKRRIAQGLPTFIFLGEEIDTKDPRSAIADRLGIGKARMRLLAALNTYAMRQRKRLLVIVDAVNESLVKPNWDVLNQAKRFKNLGVVLSVRSGFEGSDVPRSIRESYVQVEHRGFAEHEWDAVTKFFAEYKLPLPEVPILFPEFRTPLFLKIFCESFANSNQSIKGHYGFTHIFEQYVKRQGIELLKRLGEPANAGTSRKRVWNGVIKELATYMGEMGVDRVPLRVATTIASKEFPSRGVLTLGLLEKYWLLTKAPRYKKGRVAGFEYRFPYQKFSDHLIARNLLTLHLQVDDPVRSFKKAAPLGKITAAPWSNQGLIEALSIQVPERLRGRELVHLAPTVFRRHDVAVASFLESLVWRDLSLKNGKPKFIRQKRVLEFLNKHVLPYADGKGRVLETVLTVAAIPNHPLNARLLDGHLRKMKLPERDAYWLPFINSRFGDEGAIRRLVTWAWSGEGRSRVSSESLQLAGTTLAWFLASSNRFLRDQTTKALVSMFVGRISEFMELLKRFEGTDDPYVLERLYAAAYGCALQPGALGQDLAELATYVYARIFKDGQVPSHLLLRDYARGLVELGLARGNVPKGAINIKLVRPPYGSALETAPSFKSLKRKYYPYKKNYKRKKPEDYWSIWHSVMYNNEGGLGDFGNYVVNSTVGNWCNLRLLPNGSRPKTAKELEAEFVAGLDASQLETWRSIEEARSSLGWRRFAVRRKSEDAKTSEASGDDLSILRAELLIRSIEGYLVASLSRKMQGLYRRGVLACRKNPRGHEDLDYAEIQRLIFKRVLNLGWTPKLFHQYDLSLNEHGRSPNKIERIGKKYQWIALYEVLGQIADNYAFRGGWSDDLRPYLGSWQVGRRDIDPSNLLRGRRREESGGRAWWETVHFDNWRPSIGHTAWTQVQTDLPSVPKMLRVNRRGDWILLDGHYRWEQPSTPGRDKYDLIRRDVWYMFRSYLVKRDDGDRVLEWAKQQNFMGRWMPEPWDIHEIFAREFPNELSYADAYAPNGLGRWALVNDKQRKETGMQVLRTSEEYSWERGGYDCSMDEGVRIKLPAAELFSAMRLRHSERLGQFVDPQGRVVAIDPSVETVGPSALLIKRDAFLEFLARENYQLMWTVLGEKLLIGGGMGSNEFLGRLEISGAYRLSAQGVLEGKAHTKVLQPRLQ